MTKRHAALTIPGAILLLIISVSVAAAHDMFAKPAAFFVAENSVTLVRVLNGTFSKSENSIARTRVQDISLVSPSGRERIDTAGWTVAGDTSTFSVKTGGPGTYVASASTRPNIIALSGEDFNLYLKDDGIPDELEARRRAGELNRGVRERYSKHIKALLQVGTARTESYATALGYPAELLPLTNPYSLRVGQTLRLQTLVDGKPAANQYVLYGGRTPSGARIEQRNVRSDSKGVAAIPLAERGVWYVKFINMARLTGDPDADYESKWATITFEVR